MKKIILKWIFVLSAIMLLACDNEGPIKYMQFTSDDLAHLYYDNDTLTYYGQVINFHDTVYFLLNASDTIVLPVETKIYSSKSPWSIVNLEYIYGSSDIRFDKCTGFVFASISTNRTDNRWNSEKRFEVGMANMNYNGFSKVIRSTDTIQSLDTAWVLGRLYQDVYKFYGPNENNYSHVKTVYFAKKYGYIKIESIDNKKLELIKIKSMDSVICSTRNNLSH